jgi:hypothetical protein
MEMLLEKHILANNPGGPRPSSIFSGGGSIGSEPRGSEDKPLSRHGSVGGFGTSRGSQDEFGSARGAEGRTSNLSTVTVEELNDDLTEDGKSLFTDDAKDDSTPEAKSQKASSGTHLKGDSNGLIVGVGGGGGRAHAGEAENLASAGRHMEKIRTGEGDGATAMFDKMMSTIGSALGLGGDTEPAAVPGPPLSPAGNAGEGFVNGLVYDGQGLYGTAATVKLCKERLEEMNRSQSEGHLIRLSEELAPMSSPSALDRYEQPGEDAFALPPHPPSDHTSHRQGIPAYLLKGESEDCLSEFSMDDTESDTETRSQSSTSGQFKSRSLSSSRRQHWWDHMADWELWHHLINPAGASSSPLEPILLGASDATREAVLKDMRDGCDDVLGWLLPTSEAVQNRLDILNFIENLVGNTLRAQVFPTGSFALRTFLPSSDIDVSAFMVQGQTPDWYIKVNESLCIASSQSFSSSQAPAPSSSPGKGGKNTMPQQQQQQLGLGPGGMYNHLKVHNVSFVNADVKIIKCVVNNIHVDISANQVGAVAAVSFYDHVDRVLGRNHIFKQSLLLIKAWLQLEGPRLYPEGIGMDVLNAAAGGLSTYALQVLVLCAINNCGESMWHSLSHPLDILLLFLQVYSEWDFESHVVSFRGKLTTQMQSVHAEEGIATILQDGIECPFFTEYNQRYGADGPPPKNGGQAPRQRQPHNVPQSSPTANAALFGFKCCNIVDPLNPLKNVGRSMSQAVLACLQTILRAGVKQMTVSIRESARSLERPCSPLQNNSPCTQTTLGKAKYRPVSKMFERCWQMYGKGDGWREDVMEHPREIWGQGRYSAQAVATLQRGRPGLSELIENMMVDQTEVCANLNHAYGLLEVGITAQALLALISAILKERGPLPVGEVGKRLQEVTQNAQMSNHLKEMYGGLKKFMENQPMLILGCDHQFNPHTYLRDSLDKDELQKVSNGGERVYPRRLEGLVGNSSSKQNANSSSKHKSRKVQQQQQQQGGGRRPSNSSQSSSSHGGFSPPMSGLQPPPEDGACTRQQVEAVPPSPIMAPMGSQTAMINNLMNKPAPNFALDQGGQEGQQKQGGVAAALSMSPIKGDGEPQQPQRSEQKQQPPSAQQKIQFQQQKQPAKKKKDPVNYDADFPTLGGGGGGGKKKNRHKK